MFYLVGVNHNIQRPFRNEFSKYEYYSDYEKKKFFNYIAEKTLNYDIKFIAEEFNEDAKKNKLSDFSIDFTLLENLAKDNNIKHIFIDPNIKERSNLNIPTPDKKPFEMREKFWLSKIPQDNNGLVVIGSDHIVTFSSLLKLNRTPFAVLISKWDHDSHASA